MAKLEAYNQVAQKVDFARDPDEQLFEENRKKARDLKVKAQEDIDRSNQELRKLENEKEQVSSEIGEVVQTVQTLLKNKNNIAGRVAEIREDILEHIGADKEEIPFAGELIRVREE